MNLNSYFISHKQFNARKSMCLDVKVRIIKYLEENIGEYVYNLRVTKDFLDRTQKALIKSTWKLINWTSLRMKYFCYLKNIVKKMKGKAIE